MLAEREAAGLGFGTGFDHAELPEALVEEAAARGLPLFEIPYEMPFIALTECAFTKLVNEGYSVLERGIEVHALLEGLVLAERGLGEVMRAIAESVGGAALLLDDRGHELARHPQERGLPAAAVAAIRAEVSDRSGAGRQAMFVAEEGTLAGRAVAVPVPIGGTGPRGHWLVVARRSGSAGDLERLIARQAAMVVALELMRERAVGETERRLAGDVLAEALGGNLGTDELRGRLHPFGIDGRDRRPPLRSRGRPGRPREARRRTARCGGRGARRRQRRRPAGRSSARSSTPTTAIRSSWPARASPPSARAGRSAPR